MRFVKLIDMQGVPFALRVENIKEIYTIDSHAVILTYDDVRYHCKFSCEHIANLINDILSDEINEVMTRVNDKLGCFNND